MKFPLRQGKGSVRRPSKPVFHSNRTIDEIATTQRNRNALERFGFTKLQQWLKMHSIFYSSAFSFIQFFSLPLSHGGKKVRREWFTFVRFDSASAGETALTTKQWAKIVSNWKMQNSNLASFHSIIFECFVCGVFSRPLLPLFGACITYQMDSIRRLLSLLRSIPLCLERFFSSSASSLADMS